MSNKGCKYCKHNKYDYIHQGTNICDKYTTHINPYDESDCDGFQDKEAKNEDSN